jgi:hypothetical protein
MGSAFANLPLSVEKAYVLAAFLSGLDYVCSKNRAFL